MDNFPFSGLIEFSWSSGCYLLAYLVGCLAFAAMAKRRHLLTEGIGNASIVGLIGGLIGANITQFFAAGSGGKTVLGGILAGYLCVIIYKKIIGLHRPTGDLFAVALMAGEAIGRWGCFFGGCCYGRECHLPFAVYQHDVWRHPTQIYMSLACFGILAILLYVEFRRPLPENGLFYLQGLLYCPARFIVEFFRDGHSLALGLSLAQWCCIAGSLFFAQRFSAMLQKPLGSGEKGVSPC